MSWKQVSKDRVRRDLTIESRSENDFRLQKKYSDGDSEWRISFEVFSSSGIFLKWSIILVRIFCRRTWRFGIWWCWIWGSGSDNSKWHRICKAYQFINRSSAYYSNIYVIVTTRLVIVFVSQPKKHENTKKYSLGHVDFSLIQGPRQSWWHSCWQLGSRIV